MIQIQPTSAFLQLLEEAIADQVTTTITGTTGVSVTVTATSSLAGVAIGAVIEGVGIVASPPTTIVALDDAAHTLTLSQAATGIHAAETLTITNPGPLTNIEVGLYTALANPPSVNSLLADVTEPTYTGYARQAIAVEAIRRNANGDFLIPFDAAAFQPTNNVALPQTAIGVFLVGTYKGATALLKIGPLAAPFVFTSSFSGFDLDWEEIVPNQLVFGGICSTC